MEFARIDLRDGAVVSCSTGDIYFSAADGVHEAEYVYPAANRITERCAGTGSFTVGELGFGTGLNCALTLMHMQASREDVQSLPKSLRYVSFEKFPLMIADMHRVAGVVAESQPVLFRIWTGLIHGIADGITRQMERPPAEPMPIEWEFIPGCTVALYLGDAAAVLPGLSLCADAWYLDGFSPDMDPDLWDRDLLAEVTRCTSPGGSCSSFTSAGWVRRNLQYFGWQITRAPGYGRKRHMTIGHLI
ncbi:MAG: tRNA (5-methylaminomethyl-2-thiouridine)(34)-methyltransferase MnmD [Spirochaeta sp.]